jgi:cobalt-zinc-cadmium efflux system outer membrane protein
MHRDVVRRAVVVLAACLAGSLPPVGEAAEAPPLSLPEALALVADHPLLAGRAAGVAAARARADVAGQTNPWELTGNVNNFAVLGNASGFGTNESVQGFDVAEFTVELGRSFELGGKAGARRRVADAETELASAALAVDRYALESGVQQAWWEALVARERVALARTFVAAADEFTAVADRRVQAGAASAAESEAARALAARRRSELAAAEARVVAADTALGAALGTDGPRQPAVAPVPAPAPQRELPADLGPRIDAAPALAAARLGVAVGDASVTVAELAARPDVRLGAGVRYLKEFDATAFVAGVTVPLGTAARAAPGTAAARAERQVAEAQALRLRQQLAAEARALEIEARTAADRYRSLEDEILPRSRAAVTLLERGFGLGRFTFAELAAARQAVIDAEAQRLDAALAYRRAVAGLVALVGPLDAAAPVAGAAAAAAQPAGAAAAGAARP